MTAPLTPPPDGDAAVYDASFDASSRNDSHTLLFEHIGAHCAPGARVLDVGCGSGALGAALRSRGLHVTGVEPHEAAARAAATRLDAVFHGLLDGFLDASPAARFDAVMCGDVLEHMAEPALTLRRLHGHLNAGGVVAASVPNVTHGSVRAMLLEGRWDTGPRGILDDTHLRFFSRRALVALFSDTGFAIDMLAATTQRVRHTNAAFSLGLSRRAIAWAEWLATEDSVDVFQHVAIARPAPAGQAAAALNAAWADGSKPLVFAPGAAPRPRWRRRAQAGWTLLRGA